MSYPFETTFASAPIQTKETTRTLPERYLTFLIPAFLHFARSKLFSENNRLILSMNGVGTSIQNARGNASDKQGDLYSYNSAQINTLKEWLYSNFGLEDYEIWRDDTPAFKSFLDECIPKFLANKLLNVEEVECNLCSGCENIFSLGEAQVSNSCNNCGSTESVKRVIDCMCLDASKLDTSIGERVITRIINPVSKEFKGALKQRFGQFPNTLLASRTNREGGYSLKQYGLPNQQLDPEIGIALFPLMAKLESENLVITQGQNTFDKAMPFTELLDPEKARNSYILHHKVPIGTLNKYLESNSPHKTSFLQNYLPAILANSVSALTESEIDKLWLDFVNTKKVIQNFSFYTATAKDKIFDLQFLTNEEVKQFSLLKDSGNSQVLDLGSRISGIKKTFTQVQKNKHHLVDYKDLEPAIEVVYGSQFEFDTQSTEAIIYELKMLFKEDPLMRKNILALLHFGSSHTYRHKPGSDIDIHLVAKDLDDSTYLNILSKIKTFNNKGVKIDFSMHAEYEFFNEKGEFVFRHGKHGDNLILPLSLGTAILGKNIYSEILTLHFDIDGYIKSETKRKKFEDSELLFKSYFQGLRKAFISNVKWVDFKKFFGRAIGTFMYSKRIITPHHYNEVSSDYSKTVDIFLEQFGGVISSRNTEIITENGEYSDEEKESGCLTILDDLNKIINGNDISIIVLNERYSKIQTRPGTKLKIYRSTKGDKIVKVGTLEEIAKAKIVQNSVCEKGFRAPLIQTGPASDENGYLIEKSFGDLSFGDFFDSKDSINPDQQSYQWGKFISQIGEHFKVQLTAAPNQDLALDLTTKISELEQESQFPSTLKQLVSPFLRKLKTRLSCLPIIPSHNDIHFYNVLEKGIIDWAYFGNNYLGYDVLIPFYLSGNTEPGKLLKHDIPFIEFEKYLKHLDLLSTSTLNTTISEYFEDFFVLKLGILCLSIGDKDHLTSRRYPLFEIAIQNYLNDVPNKNLIWPEQ